MRIFLAAGLFAAACGAAEAQSCFRDCLNGRIDQNSDDVAVKDAARECGEACEAKTREALEKAGLWGKVEGCRGEPLSLEDFRKVRAASPSFYVQSNVFVWEARNPFDDRVITRVDVSGQNLQLSDMAFTAAGLAPPGGVGTFIVPGYYDGYPGARLAGKIQTVYACPIR